jgi:hypothetical protein
MFVEIFLLKLRREVVEQRRDQGSIDGRWSAGSRRPDAMAGFFVRSILRIANSDTANKHELGPTLLPPEATDLSVAITCRCGRYRRRPARLTYGVSDRAIDRLEPGERTAWPNRVSAREMECWETGVQSMCCDPGCAAFAKNSHASPPLKSRGDEALQQLNWIDHVE